MGTKPKYIRWLFDNKEAFEKTIVDPRYHYNMLHTQFMAIYNEYRNGLVGNATQEVNTPNFNSNPKPAPAPVSSYQESPSSQAGQIMTQEEIDLLISGAMS